MKLKTFKPSTPSRRNLIQLNKLNLKKKPLLKTKIKGFKNNAGRSSCGQITTWHRGGGHKKRYRSLNFNRTSDVTSIVLSLEYDPNRTSNIAAIYNINTQTYDYILAPKNLKVGDIIKSGKEAEAKNGHSLPIAKIPIGSLLHNVSTMTSKEAQLSRAAGTYTELMEKSAKSARIKLSSGEQRTVSTNCYATIGIVSNELLFLTTTGKAGRSRWLNRRPIVRGVAMNPVDHPHGGGEGKTSGGRSSVTPWGKPTKGVKSSRSDNKYITVKRN